MSRRIPSHQGGYTLMELMVATTIMSIMMVSVMTFMVNSIATNSLRFARADLLREAQLAVDVIVKDIRLSANVEGNNSITDANSPNAVSTGGLGWESDSNTLVLATAAQDTSDDIIFADAAHYITEKDNIIYYISSGTLYKRTLSSGVANNASTTSCPPADATAACPADRLNVKNVLSLAFHYYDATDAEVAPSLARSVEVDLTLRAIKFGRPVEVSYSTRTVFRNE